MSRCRSMIPIVDIKPAAHTDDNGNIHKPTMPRRTRTGRDERRIGVVALQAFKIHRSLHCPKIFERDLLDGRCLRAFEDA